MATKRKREAEGERAPRSDAAGNAAGTKAAGSTSEGAVGGAGGAPVVVDRAKGGVVDVVDGGGAVSQMTITPLGAGNEVGRSCIVLKFKGKTIMFDCGVHPAFQGLACLPFLDVIEPSEIDILFVSHFHLDHAAALPYITEQLEGFRGRIFMTHPTKAVMGMILADYMRVSGGSGSADEQLYDERDLKKAVDRVETVDFHQTLTAAGVKFVFLNAGHVLGAAMISIEIAGVRILYTGDYSCDQDRHLMRAVPPVELPPDVLIVEATYGVQTHETREVRERRFTSEVEQTVKRQGRCLIPVFALGRAQELLLILEEYWERHPDLHDVPIYYASKLATKALVIYQTYIAHMNEHMQAHQDRNPFKFKYITELRNAEGFDDIGPCVFMASPGMLQSGLSRMLFERWCKFSTNTTLIAGYSVEGTLAKKIQSDPGEITAMDGRILPLRCNVKYISFSAHADFLQTSNFIAALQPPTIVLVHGEANEMKRLHTEIAKKYAAKPGFQVLMPGNCDTVALEFAEERSARAIGNVAKRKLADGMRVSGVLVARDFEYQLMDAEDVPAYTALSAHAVRQRQHVPFRQSFEVLHHFLCAVFDRVDIVREAGEEAAIVCKVVTVAMRSPDRVLLTWSMSPANDMVADAVVAVVLQARSGLAAVKLTAAACGHSHDDTLETRCRLALRVLKEQFGDVKRDGAVLRLAVDGVDVAVDARLEADEAVTCEDKQVASRIQAVLRHVAMAAPRVEVTELRDEVTGDTDGAATDKPSQDGEKTDKGDGVTGAAGDVDMEGGDGSAAKDSGAETGAAAGSEPAARESAAESTPAATTESTAADGAEGASAEAGGGGADATAGEGAVAALDPNDMAVATAHAKGKLEKLTVPVLKAFLEKRNLDLNGRKADLLARVKRALE